MEILDSSLFLDKTLSDSAGSGVEVPLPQALIKQDNKIKQGKTKSDFGPSQDEQAKWEMSNQSAQAYQSYLKCKWVLSKSGQLPKESFPHSEHQEQLSEKRTEASPPLAVDRTARQPSPILDMQARVHFFRRSCGSLPNPLNWAALPTVHVKTSLKEPLLLEANLCRELSFKVWLEQNRYQGSRFPPNHIPAGK